MMNNVWHYLYLVYEHFIKQGEISKHLLFNLIKSTWQWIKYLQESLKYSECKWKCEHF